MISEAQARTSLLIGEAGLATLKSKSVIVFGLGGVGSYAAEALARSSLKRLTLVDGDVFSPSNLNRQLGALNSTLGKNKAEVMAERARDIDNSLTVTAIPRFFTEETAADFDIPSYDIVIDAIDSVSDKIYLIELCTRLNIAVISSMGAGNKLDPSRFRIGDIYKTSVCPLARVMRRELKKRGIPALTVVWSDEAPIPLPAGSPGPGSISFVPSAAGLLLAAEAVKQLLAKK